MAKSLALIPLRPVVKDWECAQSGDCCRAVGALLCTTEEKALMLTAIPQDKAETLTWQRYTDGVRWLLLGPPCPLLDGNRCSIYPVRPYQCRRWGCFRPDPFSEPLEPDHGFLGAKSTRERYHQSRTVRREMALLQRKAQRWARRHGWLAFEG